MRQGYASKDYLESLRDFGSALDRTKATQFLSIYRAFVPGHGTASEQTKPDQSASTHEPVGEHSAGATK